MLRVFQRIRMSFINSGSIRKYVLYALGEIALVVIGILIALQINNWNENEKLKKEETFYLNELYNDFKANKTKLENEEQNIKTSIHEIENVLLYKNVRIPDSVNTLELLRNFYGLSVPLLELSEGAINELSNTGKLHVIRDQQLRRDISNWRNKVDIAQVHISKILKFREDQLRPYMIECCPVGEEFREHHEKAIHDEKFQTIMFIYDLMLNTQMALKREPIFNLINRVIENIENQLL